MPRQMSGSTYKAVYQEKHIGVTRQTFYNMLRDGRFIVPAISGSHPRRWRVVDVEAVYGPRVGGDA